MIAIASILQPSGVRCGVNGVSKKRALETVASLASNQQGHLDADELFQRLVARERLGSTGLGHGIAIPHCRMGNCQHTTAVLLQLNTPIDFDAIDGQPVDLIFALIVPEEAHEDHLQTLASLAQFFSHPEHLQALREAQNSKALYETVTQQP